MKARYRATINIVQETKTEEMIAMYTNYDATNMVLSQSTRQPFSNLTANSTASDVYFL